VCCSPRSTLPHGVALVFDPLIGFRPAQTRTLREPAETTEDGTRLVVLAVAAAPHRTDVVVEWERTGDPATCPPDSRILVHSNRAPLENGLAADLVIGTTRVNATALSRRAYRFSHSAIAAVDVITFPSLSEGANGAELSLREGSNEWHVSFSLALGGAHAKPLAVESTREGLVIRATALSRYEDEVIVELEVRGERQIRQVGAPVPSPPTIPGDSEADRAARRAEMQRHFGERARPIMLEDDAGVAHGEVRRLFSPESQRASSGQPFTSRFSVVFEAPSSDVKRATLLIPFVELNDFAPSATADLRELPLDVQLAEHRFRVVAVEPYGSDQSKIVIELYPSAGTTRFMQPARMHGSDPAFGWERHALDAELPGRDAIWMATKVGDPPIVIFTGVVLRIDGPIRLDLPLG
jgi:hypothetical protein